MLYQNEIDILCVQEAEIKYDDPQDLLEIPGYNKKRRQKTATNTV
jgi:exonuclease III